MKLDLCFSSDNQKKAFEMALSGSYRTILLQGGSGSGKTYIANMAIFARALMFEHTEHYLLKTDLKVLRSSFERSVIKFLQNNNIPQSRYENRNNRTYYYNSQRHTLTLGNGSKVYLRAIKSRRPQDETDSDLLGMEGESIGIDEATTLRFEWYEFIETRCRSAVGCPPLILLSENPDARAWSYYYFNKRVHPLTLEPISDVQKKESTYTRIESWDNALMDSRYLDILKNSGNAQRFFYGVASEERDYNQIYTYEVGEMLFRMFNIYAIDPGYAAPAAVVQIGFGGNYEVNVRELCYKKGMVDEDYFNIIDEIIIQHERYYNQLGALLPYALRDQMPRFQRIPYIIVDSARTDLIKSIDRKYNYVFSKKGTYYPKPNKVVEVIPANKTGRKENSVKNAQKFKLIIANDSKFYLSEVRKYFWLKDGSLPDEDDHLMDATLYGLRYILDTYERDPRIILFSKVYEEIEKYCTKIIA